MDYRAALICAVIANVNRSKKSKTFQPKDFMPKEKQTQSPEQMKYNLMIASSAMEKKRGKRT